MFQAKHSTSDKSRGNRMRIFSIFIDNLPIDLDNLGLKKLFSSYVRSWMLIYLAKLKEKVVESIGSSDLVNSTMVKVQLKH